MPKYRVNWTMEVEQQWTGIVEADSEEEALAEIKAGNTSNEEVVDENGITMIDSNVEGLEEEQ